MPATCQTEESELHDGVPDRQSEAYRQALDILYARINYEQLPREEYSAAEFKLDRMQALLERIGNPQLDLPAIHIAGTKGKGSTAVICAALLAAAGRRVGLFTSPHLARFEERMRVNGREPAPDEVVRLIQDVSAAADSLASEGPDRRPTFFEMTTAMAWLYFRRAAAELVVLEVGLGGRLDATNLCRPAATVITSISRDHTQLLGETLGEIAREKAGIIKPGIPVLSGVLNEPAASVIEQAAADAGAPFYRIGRDIVCTELRPDASSAPLPHWRARIRTPWREHADVRVPLAGEHQVANTALALAAFDLVTQPTAGITDETIARGLAGVQWPLRIEVLQRQPLVIADAAHNPASMAALVATLQRIPARRRIGVFSAARDKDVAEMLQICAGCFDRMVLTKFTSNPRATPVEELIAMATAAGVRQLDAVEPPLAAWRSALRDSRLDDLICISGSFFLGAELRETILSEASMHPP